MVKNTPRIRENTKNIPKNEKEQGSRAEKLSDVLTLYDPRIIEEIAECDLIGGFRIRRNNVRMTLKTRKRRCEPFPPLSHLPQGSIIRFGKVLTHNDCIILYCNSIVIFILIDAYSQSGERKTPAAITTRCHGDFRTGFPNFL